MMMKAMDLQNLQVFVTVAEERNMTNAARRLGLSQSAVSQNVRQIEDSLGVILVERDRRPLSLTPAGLALSNRATMLLSELSQLRALVVDASQGVKPDLRVGLVDSFAGTVGPLFVRELLRHASTLSVGTGLSGHHGEALLARELDLVVSTEPLIDFDNIWRQRLLSERFVIITPQSWTTTVKHVADVRRLAEQYPIVRFDRRSHMGLQVDRLLRRIDAKVPHKLEIDRADSLTSMVAAGSGWAITTPMCMVQAGDSAKRVRVHYLSDCPTDRSIYLLGRQGEYDRLLRTFSKFASELLKAQLPHFLDAIDPALWPMVEISPQ